MYDYTAHRILKDDRFLKKMQTHRLKQTNKQQQQQQQQTHTLVQIIIL